MQPREPRCTKHIVGVKPRRWQSGGFRKWPRSLFRPVQARSWKERSGAGWGQDGTGWPPPRNLDRSEMLENKSHGESGRDPFGPVMGPGRAQDPGEGLDGTPRDSNRLLGLSEFFSVHQKWLMVGWPRGGKPEGVLNHDCRVCQALPRPCSSEQTHKTRSSKQPRTRRNFTNPPRFHWTRMSLKIHPYCDGGSVALPYASSFDLAAISTINVGAQSLIFSLGWC